MNSPRGHLSGRFARGQNGVTLVEMLIAMALGLVVVGGVIAAVVSNSQTYRTNQALAKVQEGTRTAYEILARDLRQAGGIGCGTTRVANALNGTDWWRSWIGVQGYDGAIDAPAVSFGSDIGQRVATTDAILVHGFEDRGLTVDTHDAANASITLNATSTDILPGDILIVCDFDHATILQASTYDAAAVAVAHEFGANPAPGNCTQGLGFPTDCSTQIGNPYRFQRNSHVGRMTATTWYIGNNGRSEEGGRSLFRVRLGPAATVVTEEIVAGITDMQLRFRERDAAAFTDIPANWADVVAIEVELRVSSADQRGSTDPSVNQGRLDRSFTTIVAIRNRVQ